MTTLPAPMIESSPTETPGSTTAAAPSHTLDPIEIAMLSSLGFERIDQHARRLATHLVDRVAELGWRLFRPLSDPSAAPHIVSLRTPITIRG